MVVRYSFLVRKKLIVSCNSSSSFLRNKYVNDLLINEQCIHITKNFTNKRDALNHPKNFKKLNFLSIPSIKIKIITGNFLTKILSLNRARVEF